MNIYTPTAGDVGEEEETRRHVEIEPIEAPVPTKEPVPA
jgi:hypothetical protein